MAELIKRVLDKDFVELTDEIETVVAGKLKEKIDTKKKEVLLKLNNMKHLNNDEEDEE